MTKEEILALIKTLNVTTETIFVPLSQSRNKDEKHLSLNYAITVTCNGKPIFTTDYSMGVGHLKGYPHNKRTIDYHNAIQESCESGKDYLELFELGARYANPKAVLPDYTDVWFCLISDADVLNYGSFEDWAWCFGYDPDSRKAEKIYQECLKHALALKGALGYVAMEKLQEAFQDY